MRARCRRSHRSTRSPPASSDIKSVNAYKNAPTPVKMIATVNARPAADSACTSPYPTVVTVITVM